MDIAHLARSIHARGWAPATSGNFSVRLADGDIAITASGRDKSTLTPADILRADPDGVVSGTGMPSAETALHVQLYRRDAEIGAVLHTHSLYSLLASEDAGSRIRLAGLEILKAFPAFESHEAVLEIPVFDNDQDIQALANRVSRHMDAHGAGWAYLIRGHGLYTWGAFLPDARRHLEAMELLLEYHVRLASTAGRRADSHE